MQGPIRQVDEAAQQAINDRSVIDHLIQVFHGGSGDLVPRPQPPVPPYEQIRREWVDDLPLGTGRRRF
jgi:hypothetical protein